MFKTHILGFVLTLLLPVLAQAQISHDLEIFSEDGLKFKVVSNGVALNEDFQSNVKLKNVEHDYINAVIYLEGEEEPILTKKYLQIGEPGVDNSPAVAAVYKIIYKKGKYKLKFVSRSRKKIQY